MAKDDNGSEDGGSKGGNEGETPPTILDAKRFVARDEDYEGANDEGMAIRLSILEEEHRDLDTAIHALEDKSSYDRLSIARLKKRKLQLKDTIKELKDAMLPDIIA